MSVALTATSTSQDVSAFFSSLGKKFEKLANYCAENGVTGDILLEWKDDNEIRDSFREMDDTLSNLQLKILCTHVKTFQSKAAGSAPTSPMASARPVEAVAEVVNYTPPRIEIVDKITMTPRSILGKLFEIQGVPLDPSDIEAVAQRLALKIPKGFGNGTTRFDVFINYRVAADADIAEKLYLYLVTAGYHPFLDKKCLKDGEKWKDGFIRGLLHSKYFLALISAPALSKVRDAKTDHTYDNVLLEYELAIKIKDITENAAYIRPVFVGELDARNGTLKKFTDFSPGLYPDSITALEGEEAARQSLRNQKPDNKEKKPKPAEKLKMEAVEEEEGDKEDEDEAEPEEEGDGCIECPDCCEYLVLADPAKIATLFPNGKKWSCYYPTHDGDDDDGEGQFTSSDPCYMCSTCSDAEDYLCCKTCWKESADEDDDEEEDDDEDELEAVQPLGTISRYSRQYYCRIERAFLTEKKEGDSESPYLLTLTINARCDGSKGPLPDATVESCIFIGESNSIKIGVKEHKWFTQDKFQVRGTVTFEITGSSRGEKLLSEVVRFKFAKGYGMALLEVPGTSYWVDDTPHCSGDHAMVIAAPDDGEYESGWTCDLCEVSFPNCERWNCLECSSDYCFDCHAAKALFVECPESHTMKLYDSRPDDYDGDCFQCDKCSCSAIFQRTFYHCKKCFSDYCLVCAHANEQGRDGDEKEGSDDDGDEDDEDD